MTTAVACTILKPREAHREYPKAIMVKTWTITGRRWKIPKGKYVPRSLNCIQRYPDT
jgi:hypothetical protein